MKIAFIGVRFNNQGGIENYIRNVAPRLANMGVRVTIYVINGRGEYCKPVPNIKVINIKSVDSKWGSKIIGVFLSTIWELLFGDSDVIHMNAFGPSVFSFLPRLFKRTVIVQGHGIEWKRSRWGWFGKFALKIMEYPSVAFANRVTVVSRVQQSYLQEKYCIDAVYIPTGINYPQPTNCSDIYPYSLAPYSYILFVGRIVPEKGLHYLIKAFNKLDTNLKLVIAGDYSQGDNLYKREILKLANNNTNVQFIGFVPHHKLSSLYKFSKIYVLPSELEGLPTVLLEAMSFGCLCLASDIPENIEALNGNGIVFKNKDPEDLHSKLISLIHDNEPSKQYIDECSIVELYNSHSWDNIAGMLHNLYSQTLNRRSISPER